MDINDIYRQSCDLILPYIHLEGPLQSVADPAMAEENLRKGIEGFNSIISENPNNWVAHWMIGKAYQALDENEKSYQEFLLAHQIKLSEPNVLRELALQCLRTKRFGEAVYYCQGAQEFDPEDYTLWANMAVAKMFQLKFVEAEQWANKCLRKIPEDQPSLQVLKIIREVNAGTRTAPTDFDELESES